MCRPLCRPPAPLPNRRPDPSPIDRSGRLPDPRSSGRAVQRLNHRGGGSLRLLPDRSLHLPTARQRFRQNCLRSDRPAIRCSTGLSGQQADACAGERTADSPLQPLHRPTFGLADRPSNGPGYERLGDPPARSTVRQRVRLADDQIHGPACVPTGNRSGRSTGLRSAASTDHPAARRAGQTTALRTGWRSATPASGRTDGRSGSDALQQAGFHAC